MTTLHELKSRLQAELDRDDMGSGEELEAQLATAIERAVEHHADEPFWFNRTSGTVSTVAGIATVALPAGMRIAEVVSLEQEPLRRSGLDELEHRTDAGLPSHWAESAGTIQFWPVPDAVYSLKVTGIADLGVPDHAESNKWTTEAADLIAARARFTLFRDVLRDIEGMQLAGQAEVEALSKLRRETRRRGRHPLRLRGDEPFHRQTSNINRGY